MKKSTTYILLLGALLATACAKEAEEDTTAAAERRVTSWISVHHPDAQRTEDDIWIIDGTGRLSRSGKNCRVRP